jgi:rare lipoprotein A (peptidoglycan hydrolase)
MIRLTLHAALALAAVLPHPAKDEHHAERPRDEHHRPVHCTRHTVASVYGSGDGQLGNRTASGTIYTAGLLGVAHKTIAFRRRVTLCFRGRHVTVPVLDRGPYVAGRDFDLMLATQRALRFPTGVAGLTWRYGP